MNFGGIGVTLGHEITHGFDDDGSQYDETGTLCSTWWSPKSRASFESKAQCMVHLFEAKPLLEIF